MGIPQHIVPENEKYFFIQAIINIAETVVSVLVVVENAGITHIFNSLST
jgi:hypothetical protein